MATRTLAAPTRTATKTTTKIARPTQQKNAASANGNKADTSSKARTKPTSEMTLEELSLRAYKMTYEQLHGNKSKKKVKA